MTTYIYVPLIRKLIKNNKQQTNYNNFSFEIGSPLEIL